MTNRELSGVCLVNKAAGISSFKALGPLKKKWQTRKVGFAGTLDPDASGLLVVGVGQGTKLLQFAEDLPKTYRFEVLPGCSSDSYDSSGYVIKCEGAQLPSKHEVEMALKKFVGALEQLPPRYSAIKINGKRACDRVRAGEKVILKPRQIHIYSLKLIDFSPEKWTLEMECSKGTYVRSLAFDLGMHFQCGALAQKIVRTKIGNFEAPAEAESELLQISAMVSHLPRAQLKDSSDTLFVMGREINPVGYTCSQTAILSESEIQFCQVWDSRNEFLGMGQIKGQRQLAPSRLCIDPEEYLRQAKV